MDPGFLGHVGQAERAELVGDFADVADAIMAAVVATMNMEDILHDGGQGPSVVPRAFL